MYAPGYTGPKNGDVRKRSRNDQLASVHSLYPNMPADPTAAAELNKDQSNAAAGAFDWYQSDPQQAYDWINSLDPNLGTQPAAPAAPTPAATAPQQPSNPALAPAAMNRQLSPSTMVAMSSPLQNGLWGGQLWRKGINR